MARRNSEALEPQAYIGSDSTTPLTLLQALHYKSANSGFVAPTTNSHSLSKSDETSCRGLKCEGVEWGHVC